MTDHKGSSTLFSIFALTIFTIFLLPYTFYRLSLSGSNEEAGPQNYRESAKKKKPQESRYKKLANKGNAVVLLLWLAWALLLWFVVLSSKDLKPFDPYEILQLDHGASTSEIKKAYRQLSLKFHPDKNPDPKAASYFAEYITKAYQALTDDVSRQNYEKYGHPDGPQAVDVGVALPEWIFSKDRKAAPLLLLGLVGGGVLLPLALISWYILRTSKNGSGPGGIMQETLAFYFHPKFGIKESHSLVRIPETLVCAMEFAVLPFTAEQNAPFEEMCRAAARKYPDLREKPLFWKRKPGILKAHLMLLQHLERELPNEEALHLALRADYAAIFAKLPTLMGELMKIAVLPRPHTNAGWLTPALAVVETMQCVSNAVSLTLRKQSGSSTGGATIQSATEAATALLQLPNVTQAVTRKLKTQKITTIRELKDLPEAQAKAVLVAAGVAEAAVDTSLDVLAALPHVALRVTMDAEGETEIMEGEVVTCHLNILMTRRQSTKEAEECELVQKAKAKEKEKAKEKKRRSSSSDELQPAIAVNPLYPVRKEEGWHVIVADSASNSVLFWTKVSLTQAEREGGDYTPQQLTLWEKAVPPPCEAPAAGNGSSSSSSAAAARPTDPLPAWMEDLEGQSVDLAFHAPKAGRYNLSVLVLSDSYMGVDRAVTAKVRMLPFSEALAQARFEKRNHLWQTEKWEAESDREDGDESDEEEDGSEDESDDGSRRGRGRASRRDDEDVDSEDYDSDESGELETESEEEEDEDRSLKKDK